MVNVLIQTVGAVIIGVIAAFGTIYVGRVKSSTDVKTLIANAGDALRDDLLALIDKYEKREQFLITKLEQSDQHNQTLQETVNALRYEVVALRIENQELRSELQKTRKDIEAFDKSITTEQ